MPDDLTITITVKQSPIGDYSMVNVDKPQGMKLAEVIGAIEQAKFELMLSSLVPEEISEE